jgi:hypothetical protein
MGNIVRILEISVKVVGFILAEVIPFGRAIQGLFKPKK